VRLGCEQPIELRSGAYSARIAPAAGGRLASLAWNDRPLLVPWNGGDFDEHAWPKAGAFPMLPFSNRLPAAGFRFGDRVFRPEPGPTGFALHGFAHRRKWDLVQASADRALLRCAHDGQSEGWPWAWSAQQEVLLAPHGITVTLMLTNESGEPMPAGPGWHPYHPVGSGVAGGDLQFEAGARRDLDAQGTVVAAEREPTFAVHRGDTAAFSAWTGALRLRGGDGVVSVRSGGAPHLVLHRPRDAGYLCAEPVALLPGQLGAVHDGDGVLLPGDTQRLSWACGFEPLR
jgi:aldose 1-epimerase